LRQPELDCIYKQKSAKCCGRFCVHTSKCSVLPASYDSDSLKQSSLKPRQMHKLAHGSLSRSDRLLTHFTSARLSSLSFRPFPGLMRFTSEVNEYVYRFTECTQPSQSFGYPRHGQRPSVNECHEIIPGSVCRWGHAFRLHPFFGARCPVEPFSYSVGSAAPNIPFPWFSCCLLQPLFRVPSLIASSNFFL
jgi:hypothetical protein